MPRTPRNWPIGALPRGLDREQAAFYVGLSPTTFAERVRDGVYPEPQQHGRRRLWDRAALDAAMDRMGGLSAAAASAAVVDYEAEARALRAIQERLERRRKEA